MIIGTYIGIVSVIISVAVGWWCLRCRRRFPSTLLTVCAGLAFFAAVWAGLTTYAETSFMTDRALQRTLDAWKAAGQEPKQVHTLAEFRPLIAARNNSMIISNVVASLIATAIAGGGALTESGYISSRRRRSVNR